MILLRRPKENIPKGRRNSSTGTNADTFDFKTLTDSSSEDEEEGLYTYDNPVTSSGGVTSGGVTSGGVTSGGVTSGIVTSGGVTSGARHGDTKRPSGKSSPVRIKAAVETPRGGERSVLQQPSSYPPTPSHDPPRFAHRGFHMDIFHQLDSVNENDTSESDDPEVEEITRVRGLGLQPKTNQAKRTSSDKKHSVAHVNSVTHETHPELQNSNISDPDVLDPSLVDHSSQNSRRQISQFPSLPALNQTRPNENHRLQLQPLTQSLHTLNKHEAVGRHEEGTRGSNKEEEEEEEEGKKPKTKNENRRGSWLSALVKLKSKTRTQSVDAGQRRHSTVDGDSGEGDKKTRGLSVFRPFARLFARRGSEANVARVFTVADTTGSAFFQEEIAHSATPSPPGSGTLPRSTGDTGSHLSIPHISLLRRASTYGHDLALLRSSGSASQSPSPSRSPSPLVRLSAGHLFSVEEDAVSITSSMTSLSLGSLSDSCESGRSSPQLPGDVTRAGSSGAERTERGKAQQHPPLTAGKSEFGSEEHDRSGHLSDEDRRAHPHPRCVRPLTSSRCQSASTCNLHQRDEVEGPHGQLFTAWLFNRIGRKGALANVTHVNHVYKGTVLITDMLGGKIVFAARSGRSAKVFATEQGAEPWCACITPKGHVAVTLRRLACVTVWSGHGSLVREFGHGVLQCPSGLACDRQGRFIVTDERSNRVAVFSPTGEFLHYLMQAPQQTEDRKAATAKGPRVRATGESRGTRPKGEYRDTGNDGLDDDEDMDEDWRKSDRNGNDRNGNDRNGNDRNTRGRDKTVTWSLHHADSDEDEHLSQNSDGSSENHNKKKLRSADDNEKKSGENVTHIVENGSEVSKTPTKEPNNNSNNNNDCTPYEFNLPRYVCVTMSGKVVVSDSGSHSVKVFSPDGIYLHSIGSYGSGDGQLKVPYGVCSDQQENIYIADHYNDRVSVFSVGGVFLQHALTSLSGLSRPKSVAVRPAHARKLYIAHGGLRATEVLVYRLVSGRQNVAFKCDV